MDIEKKKNKKWNKLNNTLGTDIESRISMHIFNAAKICMWQNESEHLLDASGNCAKPFFFVIISTDKIAMTTNPLFAHRIKV